MNQFLELGADYQNEVIQIIDELKSPEFNWNKDKILSSMNNGKSFGVLNGQGALLSFVVIRRVSPEVIEIDCLATSPQAQKKGSMEALLRWVFQKYNGAAQEIWLEVHEKNEKALSLYSKLGFRQTGVRKSYYQDNCAAILCTKNI
jgi:ribosomal-protein-alanine N-acetyltransferase